MATRENQGLQVALILMSMLTVVLGVTTYMFYRKAEEQTDKAKAADTSQKNAMATAAKALTKVQVFNYMLGRGEITREQVELEVANDTEMSDLIKKFDADMTTLGEGLPAENRNYTTVAAHISAAIQIKNNSITDTKDRNEKVEAEIGSVKTAESARTQEAVTAQQKSEADLVALRGEFDTQYASFKSKLDTTAQQLAATTATVTQTQTHASQQVAVAQKQVTSMQSEIDTVKSRLLEVTKKDIERPDGKVTRVNPQTGTIVIDLGTADGLSTKVTFAVYDMSQTGLKTAPQKGRVEVIDVTGPHRAEARVVAETSVSDPILPGDLIYSALWVPGRPMRVALAGFMDINKDGRSDRDYIRSVITLNGGLIDAELLDDGTPKGRISDQTSYLVIGDRPTETTEQGFRDEFGNMSNAANQRGIEVISVQDLLDLIGWKPDMRRITLGEGASVESDAANQFRSRTPAGAQPPPGAGAGAGAPGANGGQGGAY